MGEVRYDHFRRDTALRWIADHPGRFSQLTLGRIVEFWFPRWEGGAYHRSLWVITILSGGGLDGQDISGCD